jgi:hypothetical protein
MSLIAFLTLLIAGVLGGRLILLVRLGAMHRARLSRWGLMALATLAYSTTVTMGLLAVGYLRSGRLGLPF